MRKNAPSYIVATLFCVALFCIHREYLGRTGHLPGVVETFRPAIDPAEPSCGSIDGWAVVPDPPGQANVYAIGPRGPDGTIEVRSYFARHTRIDNYLDASGRVRWRVPTPEEVHDDPNARAATPYRVHEPIDSKGLAETLKDLNQRLNADPAKR
jgi:hypothetical protein